MCGNRRSIIRTRDVLLSIFLLALLLSLGCRTSVLGNLPKDTVRGYVEFYFVDYASGDKFKKDAPRPQFNFFVYQLKNGERIRVYPRPFPWAKPTRIAGQAGEYTFVIKLVQEWVIGKNEREISVTVIDGRITPVRVVVQKVYSSVKNPPPLLKGQISHYNFQVYAEPSITVPVEDK